MAVLFLEGFDKYGQANSSSAAVSALLTAGEWNASAGSCTIDAPLSSTGQSLRNAFNTGNTLNKTLPASYSRLIGGVRFQMTTLSGVGNAGIAGFLDAGTTQCVITVNGTTGTISLRNSSVSGTALSTSGSSITAGVTHYLEWDITFGNSAAYQVWLDGVSLFSGTGDTTATANNTANGFIFLGTGTANPAFLDDLYLFDTSGSTNNSVLLTNPRIETSFPISDSSVQFTFGTGILGSNVSRSTAGSGAIAGFLFLRKFTPSVAATVNSISVVPAASAGSAQMRGVIYADSGGAAGTLMSSGSTVTGAVSGTPVTLPLTTPQSLSAGTPYWLGFMTDSAGNTYQLADGLNSGYRVTATFSSGAPSTAPALLSGQPSVMIWGNLTGITVNWNEVATQPPAGAASYVYDSTVNHEDLYTFTPLSATPALVHTVAVKGLCGRTDTGTRTVSLRTKSGATDSGGSLTGQGPGSSFGWLASYFATDPAGGAWTGPNLDAATSGIKVDA